MPFRIGTLCSGIGVPEKVFDTGGNKIFFCAENNKFPSAELAYHYPHVPNLGDIQKIDGREWEGKIDLLIGGPPCQAFSAMGKGESLNDPRGMLTLEYVRLLHEINPALAIYENVPHILGAELNPWGRFLARITNENEPLRPNAEPAGDEGQVKWPNSGVVIGGGKTVAWTILDAQNFGVPQRRKRLWAIIADTRKLGELVGAPPEFDTRRLATIPSEILLDSSMQRRSPATRKRENSPVAGASFAIGFSANDSGRDAGIELCPTIRSGNHVKSWANSTGGGAAVAIFDGNGGWVVRYLTTIECELAFGLPIDYTQIPWNGQPTAPDGNRKTVLGNTMAVPCLEHIKLRMDAVISNYVNFFVEQEQGEKIMSQKEILIDPELKNFIPELQPEEFEMLEASILKDGCLTPLLVWQEENVIVDGHNRYNICKKHNIRYEIKYRSFPNKDAVKLEMLVNQLSRRNLTEHSTMLMRGKLIHLMERRKQGERGENGAYTNAQLREILNVKSNKTIKRAEEYYQAIEKIAQLMPTIDKEIEKGSIVLSREEVVAIGSLAGLDKQLANEFLETPRLPDKRRTTADFKENCRRVREVVNNSYPTLEEQKKLARDPEEWANFKGALSTTLEASDEAWAEVANEILRDQIRQTFASKQEELDKRGAELGLPKNFTKTLANSWLDKQRRREPPTPHEINPEYKMLPIDLSSFSDADISVAIARLKKEQERRKNANPINLNIAA